MLAHLQTFLPAELITVFARKHGWFERERKLDPVIMVWTLILGFSSGAKRSIATLHRSYQRHSGSDLSYSAFRQRLDKDLAAIDLLAKAQAPRACLMRASTST